MVQGGDNSSRSLAKVLSVPPYTSNFLQLIYNHMKHTQVAFEILSYLSDLLLHLFKSYCIYCCTALLASFHQSIFFIYSFYCFCSIIDSLNAALLYSLIYAFIYLHTSYFIRIFTPTQAHTSIYLFNPLLLIFSYLASFHFN